MITPGRGQGNAGKGNPFILDLLEKGKNHLSKGV
jgi:hypothetical protein